jgi:hypothetical protein
LSAALAKTAAGGTISIIDAGGYGTVTIDKAINIINDGAGTASILVPQGEIGVFVKDPFYEARVYLRGLTIEGANVGSTGVLVNSARPVSVENCVIRNLFGGSSARKPRTWPPTSHSWRSRRSRSPTRRSPISAASPS